MHAVEPFRAFAYKDMPMAPASRNPSITTTSDRAISYRSSVAFTQIPRVSSARSRRASSLGINWRAAIAANIQLPFVTNKGNPPKKLTCIGPAASAGTQHLPLRETSIDAVSPTSTRHSVKTTTSDRRASSGNAKQPNHTSDAPLPLNFPAGDILTILTKRQVNLPTKAVMMATGPPLGMMIPTNKKFVLVGGKIRHGRVLQGGGRVAQVTPAVLEDYMARDYAEAFENGVEELEYPLTEPLYRTRHPDARRPTFKETRAAVAKELHDGVERTVEVIVLDLVEDVVACVVRDLEQEVENNLEELWRTPLRTYRS